MHNQAKSKGFRFGAIRLGEDRREGSPTQGKGRSEQNKKPRLSAQCKLLLLVNGLFATANALSGTFVNVYLWKVKNDYTMIATFAISQQVMTALLFWLAGKWIKEYNKMNALRAGVAVSAIFYSAVLLAGTRAVDYVLWLGAIQGISAGLFWSAFNVVYFEVTDPDNRDRFNGWAGLLGSVAGMIAPWVSGFLITQMEDAVGYRLIFTISLVIFVIATIFSFFLKKRKPLGQYLWFYGIHLLKKPRHPWRRIALAMTAQGVREGVFAFIIGLLVYIYTQNEMKVGNYSLITSAIGLLGFMVAGRFLKPKYRRWGMFIGVAMMTLVIFPFFWKVSYFTLLVFGIGTALFIPLYSIPTTSVVFDIIGQNQESAERRVEYIVLRELALCLGRIVGALVFIAVISQTTAPLAMNLLLLGIGSSPLFVWVLLRGWLGTAAAVAADTKPDRA